MMLLKWGERRAAIASADRARDEGKPSQAVVLYRQVIDRFGPTVGLLKQLGNSLKDSGQFDEARTAYLAVLKRDPSDADCYLQLGHLMKLVGSRDASAEFYRVSLKLEPAHNPALQELEAFTSKAITSIHRLPEVSDVPRPAPTAPTSTEGAVWNGVPPHWSPASKDQIDTLFGHHNDLHGWDIGLPAMVVCKRLLIQLNRRC